MTYDKNSDIRSEFFCHTSPTYGKILTHILSPRHQQVTTLNLGPSPLKYAEYYKHQIHPNHQCRQTGQTNLFRPYDLPYTPHATNTFSVPSINSVV